MKRWSKLILLLAALLLSVTALGEEVPAEPDVPDSGEDAPAESSLPLSVTVRDAVLDQATWIWYITLNPESHLVLQWTAQSDAEMYGVSLFGPGSAIFSTYVSGTSLSYPMSGLTTGTYRINVTAIAGGVELRSVSPTLVLVSSDGDSGGSQGKPPGHGGHPNKPGGGSGGVVPGQALTKTHARGSGDMSLYGTVEAVCEDGPMETLVLGGQTLDIDHGGDPFTAEVDGTALILRCGAEGGWRFSQSALHTLARSGITRVVCGTASGDRELDTGLSMEGRIYASLRAKGYVSKDFIISLDTDGLTVSVDGQTWLLTDSGQLEAG